MDGLTATETFRAIVKRVRRMVEQQYACWREELLPALAANGIRLLELAELDQADRAWVEDYYHTQVRPVLTPLAIDPAHPFPQLLNKSLNLIVRLEMARHRRGAQAHGRGADPAHPAAHGQAAADRWRARITSIWTG